MTAAAAKEIHLYVFGGGENILSAVSDRRILQSVGAFSGCPPEQLPGVLRPEGRKPRFERPVYRNGEPVGFSVSHSGAYWVCAVSEQELGVDLQKTACKLHNDIAARFFHPDEAAYAAGGTEAFFEVWTAKESYVKFTGEGIGGRFSQFSVVDGGALRHELDGVRLKPVELDAGYRLCVCAREIGGLKIIFAGNDKL